MSLASLCLCNPNTNCLDCFLYWVLVSKSDCITSLTSFLEGANLIINQNKESVPCFTFIIKVLRELYQKESSMNYEPKEIHYYIKTKEL